MPIDADLQDPPELIPALVARWREGDVALVDAVRRSRDGEGWFKRLSAHLFYRVMGRLSQVPVRADLGDFRLLDRRAVEAFKRLPERTRFVKGLFAWIGMPRAEVAYDRAPRAAGKTSWSYWRLWNFALDGILSHSSVPLRVWTYGGAAIALAALAFALYRIVRTLVWGVDVPGYASIMVAILFIGGVLGQYLKDAGIGAYVGEATGYVLKFSNGLVAYLSGDTGITGDQDKVVRGHYNAKLAVMNIGDTFTTGPTEAAYVINDLVKPNAVIASHANEVGTVGGKVRAGSRTETFIKASKVPVHVPLSGKTMEFNADGKCVGGC